MKLLHRLAIIIIIIIIIIISVCEDSPLLIRALFSVPSVFCARPTDIWRCYQFKLIVASSKKKERQEKNEIFPAE